MAVFEVLRMGHPTLRKRARPLLPEEVVGQEMESLIADMQDTLHAYGGIGLAAPQIDRSVRLAIIEIIDSSSRYGEIPLMPLTVYFNPEITVLSEQTQGFWEGCLSIPGLRGYVERPQHIRVDYLDQGATPQTVEFDGFLATVLQHELDHLDGILYVDRLKDSKLLSFEEEFVNFSQQNNRSGPE